MSFVASKALGLDSVLLRNHSAPYRGTTGFNVRFGNNVKRDAVVSLSYHEPSSNLRLGETSRQAAKQSSGLLEQCCRNPCRCRRCWKCATPAAQLARRGPRFKGSCPLLVSSIALEETGLKTCAKVTMMNMLVGVLVEVIKTVSEIEREQPFAEDI